MKYFYLSDPVSFPKKFKDNADIETSAFVAAVFAIGPRYAIFRTLGRIFDQLGKSPHESIMNLDHGAMKNQLKDHIQFAYKNITGQDVVQILYALKRLINSHGSIQDAAREGNDSETAFGLLNNLIEKMKSYEIPRSLGGELTPRARALLATPKQGSACKRMNMFLRWMTRKDEIDFGLYDWLGTDKLVIPLDVNVSRAARKLDLTKRKTDNWKTAVEITQRLKELDSVDPVKYDVPLFLYGMELRKNSRAS